MVSKKSKNVQLPDIPFGNHPKVLLVGNGINLSFSGAQSTDAIIQREYEKNHKESNIPDCFKKLPFPMQVVVATNDNVISCMDELAKVFKEKTINDEQRSFIMDLLDCGCETVLSTNYSLEIEQAVMNNYSAGKIPNLYRYTDEIENGKTSDNFNLRRYISLLDRECSLWHIHGISLNKQSMVMGHYYYGKLLAQAIPCVKRVIKNYKSRITREIPYTPKSWIDYFLIGDVYSIGFKMDLSELDLWWLLECKKAHFPESKFYFYEPEEIEDEKRMMLENYNVSIPQKINLKDKDYLGYYRQVFKSIKES